MGAAGAELMLNCLTKRDKNDIDVQKAMRSAERKRSFTLKDLWFSVIASEEFGSWDGGKRYEVDIAVWDLSNDFAI